MLQLRHRDLDHHDLVLHLVRDLVYLQRPLLLDHLNDMDHLKMVHLFRCVVDIVILDPMRRGRQQDVEMKDVLQIQDEQNLDEVLTFLDEVRQFLVLADVQVGVELRHLLKMDCFQDVVGVELRHPLYPLYRLRTDCYLDEVLALVFLHPLHFHLKFVVLMVLMVWAQQPLPLQHVML
jgi:hypothetical protein